MRLGSNTKGFDLSLVCLHRLSTGFLQGFDGVSTIISTLAFRTGFQLVYTQVINSQFTPGSHGKANSIWIHTAVFDSGFGTMD